MIGCVVMAAGASTRFGLENKLLACYQGVPLAVRAMEAVPPGCKTVVVTGYDALAEEAERLSPEERSQGIRLACYVQVLGDALVWLPEQEVDTLSAVVLPAHTLRKKGWGLAVDIGTTTVAAQLYRLEDGVCTRPVSGPM